MSPSTFRQHFRALTGVSPLQYQKQLRLQEARQLMLNENLDAGGAGGRVGYESPSQFSREYSRLFGAPPQRDVTRMRLASIATVSTRRIGATSGHGAVRGIVRRDPRSVPRERGVARFDATRRLFLVRNCDQRARQLRRDPWLLCVLAFQY